MHQCFLKQKRAGLCATYEHIIMSWFDSRMVLKPLDQGIIKTMCESAHMVSLTQDLECHLANIPVVQADVVLWVGWFKIGKFKRDFKTKARKANGDTERPRKWSDYSASQRQTLKQCLKHVQ